MSKKYPVADIIETICHYHAVTDNLCIFHQERRRIRLSFNGGDRISVNRGMARMLYAIEYKRQQAN